MSKKQRQRINTQMPTSQTSSASINPITLKPRSTPAMAKPVDFSGLGAKVAKTMEGMIARNTSKLKAKTDLERREGEKLKLKSDNLHYTQINNFAYSESKLMQQKLTNNPESTEEDYKDMMTKYNEDLLEMAGEDLDAIDVANNAYDKYSVAPTLTQNQNVFTQGQKEQSKTLGDTVDNIISANSKMDAKGLTKEITSASSNMVDDDGKPTLLANNKAKVVSDRLVLGISKADMRLVDVAKSLNIEGNALKEGEQSMYDANPQFQRAEKAGNAIIMREGQEQVAHHRNVLEGSLMSGLYKSKSSFIKAVHSPDNEVHGEEVFSIVKTEELWNKYQRNLRNAEQLDKAHKKSLEKTAKVKKPTAQELKDLQFDEDKANLFKVARTASLDTSAIKGQLYANSTELNQDVIDGVIDMQFKIIQDAHMGKLEASGLADDPMAVTQMTRDMQQELGQWMTRNEFKSSDWTLLGNDLEGSDLSSPEKKTINPHKLKTLNLMSSLKGSGSLTRNFTPKARGISAVYDARRTAGDTETEAFNFAIEASNASPFIKLNATSKDQLKSSVKSAISSHYDRTLTFESNVDERSLNLITNESMILAEQYYKLTNSVDGAVAMVQEDIINKYIVLPNGTAFPMKEQKLVNLMWGGDEGAGKSLDKSRLAVQKFPKLLMEGFSDSSLKLANSVGSDPAEWMPRTDKAGRVFWVDKFQRPVTKKIELSDVGLTYNEKLKFDVRAREEGTDLMSVAQKEITTINIHGGLGE